MPAALPCRISYLIALLSLLAGGPRLQAETYHHWSTLHFDAALISAGLASPFRDVDGDQSVNLIEYLAGTDPRDPSSRLELEFDPGAHTVSFPMALDRVDVVYAVEVSLDLLTWSEAAIHLQAGTQVTWDLNGFRFVRVSVKRRPGFTIDSDQDGLDDFFEESLAASDPADPIVHLGQVHPADDFDQDGIANFDEEGNAPQPAPGGSYARPPLIDPAALNSALAHIFPPAPDTLTVHTPLE